VRAKGLGGRALLDLTAEIVDLARSAGALVVVNDRADIARLACAGGVHVGQDDVPPSGVRAVVGSRAVVGLSTHTLAQLSDALAQPVSYVAVGPVYGTLTKDTGRAPVGLGHVAAAALTATQATMTTRAAPVVPIVAIGGVTLDRAAATIDAGAAAVAVISDLLSTGDPARRVGEFLRVLR
jgi:thiamine-phosphate pyrophosphorylase